MEVERVFGILLIKVLLVFYCLQCSEGSQSLKGSNNVLDEPSTSASQRKSEDFPRLGTNERRRLTFADDVFSPSRGGFEVRGYHRAVSGAINLLIRKFCRGFRSSVEFMLRQWKHIFGAKMQNRSNEEAEEDASSHTDPSMFVATISSMYDSISSVISSSIDSDKSSSDESSTVKHRSSSKASSAVKEAAITSAPANNNPKKAARITSLGGNTNIPKPTSTTAASLRKSNSKRKFIMENLDKSAAFESTSSAISLKDDDTEVPATSNLVSLFPTLVAGLVFATAGSMVGYLWNSDWTEAASNVVGYFWGSDDESEIFSGDITSVSGDNQQHDAFASSATPVTPDKL